MFLKQILIELSTLKNIIENNSHTSKGYLLSENEASQHSVKIYIFSIDKQNGIL